MAILFMDRFLETDPPFADIIRFPATRVLHVSTFVCRNIFMMGKNLNGGQNLLLLNIFGRT